MDFQGFRTLRLQHLRKCGIRSANKFLCLFCCIRTIQIYSPFCTRFVRGPNGSHKEASHPVRLILNISWRLWPGPPILQMLPSPIAMRACFWCWVIDWDRCWEASSEAELGLYVVHHSTLCELTADEYTSASTLTAIWWYLRVKSTIYISKRAAIVLHQISDIFSYSPKIWNA